MRWRIGGAYLALGMLGVVGMAVGSGQLALALTASEVADIAKRVTVQIDGQTPGSGVIIHQDSDHYTLLTAAHVVETEDTYIVKTPDGKSHPIAKQDIQRLKGVDLALVKFTSLNAYTVAEIGDSTLIDQGDPSYIAGFPVITTAIDTQVYTFTNGNVIANSQTSLADGYSLIYSNQTLPGMSGGPVLNEDGQLIGIHGRADTAAQAQNPEVNPSIYIKTGFNLGISSNTFLQATAHIQPPLTSRRPAMQVMQRQPADYFIEGMGRYQNDNYQGAIESFSQALNVAPDFHIARLHRAYAHMGYNVFYSTGTAEREIGAALVDCSGYIQAQANDPQGYICRGWANYYTNNQTGAIADFTQAIHLAPQDVSTHLARGEFYDLHQEYANAIQDFSQAILLDLRSARSYGLRARSYSSSGQPERAIEDYSRAMDLDPAQDRYREKRGTAKLNMRDYPGAIQDFSMLLPKHPYLAEKRGQAYAELGQNQKALQDLNQAVQLFPYSEGDNGIRYYYRGLVLFRLGKPPPPFEI